MILNTTGNSNVAVGTNALVFNDSGFGNNAIGVFALYNNFDGIRNNTLGRIALFNNIDGNNNSAVGDFALSENITAGENTAIGAFALENNDSTGSGSAHGNTAVGANALNSNTDGSELTAVGEAALVFNDTGNDNIAVGSFALFSNVTGSTNTAVGARSLATNNADDNTAVGFNALGANDSGGANVTVANRTLAANTSGPVNTPVGSLALETNTTGTENTAVGRRALEFLDGGHENTAVGWGAGGNYSGTETNNICIGDQTAGVTGESNAIRIGDNSTSGGIDLLDGGAGANFILIGTGMGTQGISVSSLLGFGTVQMGNGLSTVALASSCNIGGIYNQSFGPADMAVRIGSDNKLGTVVSSRRFKHDIEPIDKASEAVLALKPVTFHYNSDTTNTPRFGLIAEDVAEVSPQLVIPDKEGKPLSVRYEDVNVMLLNEFLKEHKKVEEQQLRITDLN